MASTNFTTASITLFVGFDDPRKTVPSMMINMMLLWTRISGLCDDGRIKQRAKDVLDDANRSGAFALKMPIRQANVRLAYTVTLTRINKV